MPFLLPKLVVSPISFYAVRALRVISATTKETVHRNLNLILPPLMEAVELGDDVSDGPEMAKAVIDTLGTMF